MHDFRAFRARSRCVVERVDNSMVLTDEQWGLIQYLIPPTPQPVIRGMPFLDRRAVLDGILWKLIERRPWKDLPPEFPSWQTCASYYRHWTRLGVMDLVYLALYTDLAKRGRLCLAEALRDGTISITCNQAGVRLQVPASLQGSWQLATARLLLSQALDDLCAEAQTRRRIHPAARR
jgi:transposase